jgi:hypothetical protein
MFCCGGGDSDRADSWDAPPPSSSKRGGFSPDDTTTSSDTMSRSDFDGRVAPKGTNFPSWQKDDEVDECFKCDVQFSLRERKHHCRRCGTVFCNNCSLKVSPILLYAITSEVRVCDKCYNQLISENNYATNLRPILHRGDMFKKSIRMGLQTKLVTLRMMSDDKTLVYDDEHSGPTVIPLHTVEKITMTSLKAFEITTMEKSYNFSSDSKVRELWVEALKIAVQRAREPPFNEQVEVERRRKVDMKRREEFDSMRQKSNSQRRDANRAENNKLKSKYGIS